MDSWLRIMKWRNSGTGPAWISNTSLFSHSLVSSLSLLYYTIYQLFLDNVSFFSAIWKHSYILFFILHPKKTQQGHFHLFHNSKIMVLHSKFVTGYLILEGGFKSDLLKKKKFFFHRASSVSYQSINLYLKRAADNKNITTYEFCSFY